LSPKPLATFSKFYSVPDGCYLLSQRGKQCDITVTPTGTVIVTKGSSCQLYCWCIILSVSTVDRVFIGGYSEFCICILNVATNYCTVVHLWKCCRMGQILILLCVLVATVCGKYVPLLKPMSQEMIDFINNEAQTTWKVHV